VGDKIITGDLVEWFNRTYGTGVVGVVLGVKPNVFYPGVDTYSILEMGGRTCDIHGSVWPDYRILSRRRTS